MESGGHAPVLEFQLIDAECVYAAPPEEHFGAELSRYAKSFLPCVRLYGSDVATGCSVVVHAVGFLPFFYIKGTAAEARATQAMLETLLFVEGKDISDEAWREYEEETYPAAEAAFKAEWNGVAEDDFARAEAYEALLARRERKERRYRASRHVHSVEHVSRLELMGYSPLHEDYLRVTLYSPRDVIKCRDLLGGSAGGDASQLRTLPDDAPDYMLDRQEEYRDAMRRREELLFSAAAAGDGELCVDTWETNVDYPLRYLVERGIMAGQVVRAEGVVCAVSRDMGGAVDWVWHENVSPAPEGRADGAHAPLRVVSYDIEAAAKKRGVFPSPDVDPVVAIAAVCYTFSAAGGGASSGPDTPRSAVVFTWRGTDAASLAGTGAEWLARGDEDAVEAAEDARVAAEEESADPVLRQTTGASAKEAETRTYERSFKRACLSVAEVRCAESEEEMLLAFRAYIVDEADADVITGYNIGGFDTMYLWRRAARLGISAEFNRFGRILSRGGAGVPLRYRVYDETPTRLVRRVFESKAFGRRETYSASMPGRVQMDMLEWMRREHKLRSYKLDSVAAHFLGVHKIDMAYEDITPSWLSNDAARVRKLLFYCLIDALLPARLMFRLSKLTSLLAMCRVTGVPPQTVINRGQQIKAFVKLLHASRAGGYVVPYVRQREDADAVRYQGATVIEPLRGLYNTAVVTLDFEGLYPSIMRRYNLCYSTWIRPGTPLEELSLREEDVYRTPAGHTFVRQHVRVGVMPTMLESFYTERKAAQREMREARTVGDALRAAVLDCRQQALKLTANSTYGFTGATFGMLPLVAISESVTAYGRTGIDAVKSRVENYPVGSPLNPLGNVVIYGDTDSVMVDTKIPLEGVCTDEEAAGSVDDGDEKLNGAFAEIELDIFKAFPGDGDDARARRSRERFMRRSVARSVFLGMDLAEDVNVEFTRPMAIAFEKVMGPKLLVTKKRYAAMHWEFLEERDAATGKVSIKLKSRLYVRGLETARRDNCIAVSRTQERLLYLLLIEHSLAAAVAFAKEFILKLMRGGVSLRYLTISKEYSKPKELCKALQPHVELVERRRARGETDLPHLGDRVPYVIVKKIVAAPSAAAAAAAAEAPSAAAPSSLSSLLKWHAGAPTKVQRQRSTFATHLAEEKKVYNKSEDPGWLIKTYGEEEAARHIDVAFYMERQFARPWGRLLDIAMGDHGFTEGMFACALATNAFDGLETYGQRARRDHREYAFESLARREKAAKNGTVERTLQATGSRTGILSFLSNGRDLMLSKEEELAAKAASASKRRKVSAASQVYGAGVAPSAHEDEGDARDDGDNDYDKEGYDDDDVFEDDDML